MALCCVQNEVLQTVEEATARDQEQQQQLKGQSAVALRQSDRDQNTLPTDAQHQLDTLKSRPRDSRSLCYCSVLTLHEIYLF